MDLQPQIENVLGVKVGFATETCPPIYDPQSRYMLVSHFEQQHLLSIEDTVVAMVFEQPRLVPVAYPKLNHRCRDLIKTVMRHIEKGTIDAPAFVIQEFDTPAGQIKIKLTKTPHEDWYSAFVTENNTMWPFYFDSVEAIQYSWREYVAECIKLLTDELKNNGAMSPTV